MCLSRCCWTSTRISLANIANGQGLGVLQSTATSRGPPVPHPCFRLLISYMHPTRTAAYVRLCYNTGSQQSSMLPHHSYLYGLASNCLSPCNQKHTLTNLTIQSCVNSSCSGRRSVYHFKKGLLSRPTLTSNSLIPPGPLAPEYSFLIAGGMQVPKQTMQCLIATLQGHIPGSHESIAMMVSR